MATPFLAQSVRLFSCMGILTEGMAPQSRGTW